MTRTLRNRRGTALPLFILCLTAILGLAAYSIDMGYVYARRGAHVRGCDAAALAAANDFLHPDDQAGRALAVANENGLGSPATVSVSFPSDGDVLVQSSETPPSLFGGALGITNYNIAAHALARVSVPNTIRGNVPGGVRPWGVDQRILPSTFNSDTPNTLVTLRIGNRDPSGNVVTEGDFYPIRLRPSDSGPGYYEDNTRFGGLGVYGVNQVQQLEPGDLVDSTARAVSDLLNRAAAAPWSDQTPQTATAQNPRVLLLPVFDWTNAGNGQTSMPTQTFVPFYIEQMQGAAVVGRFLYGVSAPNGKVDPNLPQARDAGLRVVKLVE